MRQKVSELIPIQDAMDNLAAIVSIQMDSPPPIGILRKGRIVTNSEELEEGIAWLGSEGPAPLLEILDATYRSVYHHLLELYQNRDMDWESEKARQGISAMMSLVGESASKMDRYLAYRLNDASLEKIEKREPFATLQKFYSEKFAKKIPGGVEGSIAWEKAFHGKPSLLEATGSDLKDFDALMRDREYELFYIANEDNEPFLSAELLRNFKLTLDFDMDSREFEDDPFLKVRAMEDRDLQASATLILYECKIEIEQFYKIAKRLFHYTLARLLSKAILALFLASNTRHLLQRSAGKHCYQYFHDFHLFLRAACKSAEYQKWIAYPPPKSDKEAALLLYLTHKLCYLLVARAGGIKQEAIGLIHRTARRGGELSGEVFQQKGESFGNQLLWDDEKLRSLFAKYPSGPLMKSLETVRQEQDEGILVPFDPWIQGNLPSRLFVLKRGKEEIQVLRFACPTKQRVINKAEILDEFRGFLRFISADTKKGKKLLLINLQDRHSWKEMVRCENLELLQKNLNFASCLSVMTLPKDNDFYHQANEFYEENHADRFIERFKKQLSDERGGFFFPEYWKKEELLKFVNSAMAGIHKFVFEGKNTLSRQNRQDFIEVFYQLLIGKAVDWAGAEFIAFTCKDAVDTGAIASGTFYGFLTLLEKGNFSKEDLDSLRFHFYWPALSIRERAVDPELMYRSLSALETWKNALDNEGKKIAKEFATDLKGLSLN